MTEVQAAPVVKVAQDLTAIADLCERLLTQAVHTANDRELPGGEAMVALGPVADPHAYAENVEAAEYRHEANPRRWPEQTLDLGHEDDDLAPVLQVLWYWSCALRDDLGFPLEGRRATVASEANVIRQTLDHLWDTEPHFDDLAADIRGARRRLENILHDGERVELGVRCPGDHEDDAPRLILRYDDRDPSGNGDEYRCPGDWQHRWKVDDYRRWVGAVYVAHADRLTADDLANHHGIKPGTLRVWVTRGQVARRGRDHSGRQLYDVAQALAAHRGDLSEQVVAHG